MSFLVDRVMRTVGCDPAENTRRGRYLQFLSAVPGRSMDNGRLKRFLAVIVVFPALAVSA